MSRRMCVLGLGVLIGVVVSACDSPRIADCAPGRFVRVDGDAWCVYPRSATTRCPSTLPFEHDLPWGGRGCAADEHDPLPAGLCEAAGECAPGDGGP